MDKRTKFILDENEIPTQWYNILADMPEPMPPVLHPGTGKPIGPADLAPLFPMELIKQEVSQERWIDVPEEVRDVYKLWRPTNLFRAYRLEKALVSERLAAGVIRCTACSAVHRTPSGDYSHRWYGNR